MAGGRRTFGSGVRTRRVGLAVTLVLACLAGIFGVLVASGAAFRSGRTLQNAHGTHAVTAGVTGSVAKKRCKKHKHSRKCKKKKTPSPTATMVSFTATLTNATTTSQGTSTANGVNGRKVSATFHATFNPAVAPASVNGAVLTDGTFKATYNATYGQTAGTETATGVALLTFNDATTGTLCLSFTMNVTNYSTATGTVQSMGGTGKAAQLSVQGNVTGSAKPDGTGSASGTATVKVVSAAAPTACAGL